MKKRIVTGLIYLMAIAIVGLVALQYSFIRISYFEKQEIYNQHIFQALQNTTERLKNRQSVRYVYEQLNTRKQDSIMPVDPTMFSLNYPDGSKVSISVQSNGFSQNMVFSNNQQRRQSASINNIEEYFQSMIFESNSDFYNIMRQMENEIRLRKQPLTRLYSNKAIHNILSEELKNQGIKQPFEYAIASKGKLHPSLHSKGFKPSDLRDSYHTNLQPGAIFDYPDFLFVKLPERKAFLMDSLSMQITLSIIFILIILITFFISTYIIMRQKRLSEMKTDFISNMTHEFKTPIATIRLAADGLKNPKSSENEALRKQFTEIISQETSRLNGQVEKVLEISTLDKGEIQLKLQTHNINDLVTEAASSFDLSINQLNGKIDLQLDALQDDYIVDKEHIVNVISNLIDNGIKYSQEQPHIIVSTRNKNKWIYISVKDHGIGMDQVTLSKVFEKFYRASSINIHNVKGFGLGLHYVKEIVSAHKGIVDVSSTPGKGSTFTIKLIKH